MQTVHYAAIALLAQLMLKDIVTDIDLGIVHRPAPSRPAQAPRCPSRPG